MAVVHKEVAAHIKGDVLDNCEPGKRIPSNLDLAGRYGVSLDTVRKAIRYLIDSGEPLVTRPGAGTFKTE